MICSEKISIFGVLSIFTSNVANTKNIFLYQRCKKSFVNFFQGLWEHHIDPKLVETNIGYQSVSITPTPDEFRHTQAKNDVIERRCVTILPV